MTDEELLEHAHSFHFGLPENPIRVEKCQQRDGSILWAVRRGPSCWAGDGFELESSPSNRTDAFLARARIPSLDLAVRTAKWLVELGCCYSRKFPWISNPSFWDENEAPS